MIATGRSITPTNIFISCSPEDVHAKRELLKFLKPLIDARRIETWDEQLIKAGDNLTQETLQALHDAAIAVLILTVDYFSSSHYEIILPELRKEQKEQKLRIVPILWSACHWKYYTWLSELQVLPRSLTPVSAKDRAAVLTEIVEEIESLLSLDAAMSTTAILSDIVTRTTSSRVLPASFTSVAPAQLEPSAPKNDSSTIYVVEFEPAASSVDVFAVIAQLRQRDPQAGLWEGDTFKNLTKGWGDKRNPERMLNVSWTSETVEVKLNPLGFTDGHQLLDVADKWKRLPSSNISKTYIYHPLGKARPYRYKIVVTSGSQVDVLITDISSEMQDQERAPTLKLVCSDVVNKGGSISE